MSYTAQNIIDGILNILNEAQGSVVPQYSSNVASVPIYSSAQGLINVANVFAGRMCTTFYGWQDTGSMTPTSGVAYTALTGLATSASGTVWQPLSVTYNGASLYQTDFAHLRMNYPTLQSDPAGTPQFFCKDAQLNLILAPKPSGGVVQVQGYASPPLMSTASLSTVLSWIEDAYVPALIYGCAAEIARKNSEDLLLSGKVAEWESEYYREWANIYSKLDPGHARDYFVPPPNIPENEAALAS